MTKSQATALKGSEVPTPVWTTGFNRPSGVLDASSIRGKWIEGEARMRLVTRSGFEQKHIFTSQIASQ